MSGYEKGSLLCALDPNALREAQAAQLDTARAELREMEEDRNTYKHCFALLANRIFGGSREELEDDDPRVWVELCARELDRHERDSRLAARVLDAVEVHKRTAT